MWQSLSMVRPKADALALRLNAERAGFAWACPFSSSDEFEAAVISSKLRAGTYGPRRLYRNMLYTVAAVSVVAAIGLFF